MPIQSALGNPLSQFNSSQHLNESLQTNNLHASSPQNQANRLLQSIETIRNYCSTLPNRYNFNHTITHGKGKKLERVKASFKNGAEGLKKYNVSVNTRDYSQLGPHSGISGIKEALSRGLLKLYLVRDNLKKNKHILGLKLSKEKGNYRTELAHRNSHSMDTESIYKFQMNPISTADNIIFFQLRESGGDMRTKGKDKPVISLHLIDNNKILIVINSVNGNVLKEKIAIIGQDCQSQWHNFKIKVIWHREKPSIQVMVNGEGTFEFNLPFGAPNSSNHYSKLGIYIPHQKEKDGISDTFLLFDNVEETHRRYKPS